MKDAWERPGDHVALALRMSLCRRAGEEDHSGREARVLTWVWLFKTPVTGTPLPAALLDSRRGQAAAIRQVAGAKEGSSGSPRRRKMHSRCPSGSLRRASRQRHGISVGGSLQLGTGATQPLVVSVGFVGLEVYGHLFCFGYVIDEVDRQRAFAIGALEAKVMLVLDDEPQAERAIEGFRALEVGRAHGHLVQAHGGIPPQLRRIAKPRFSTSAGQTLEDPKTL